MNKLVQSLSALAALGSAATAATYTQNFDAFVDGSTVLGDGSTLGSSVNDVPGTIASVQSSALRLTNSIDGGQRASFRIPALAGSSAGWTATFTLTMTDAVGGNPPADGFTFNWGSIPALTASDFTAAGHGSAELGQGTGNEISAQVDTWQNGGVGPGSPGVGILQNGANVVNGRTDGIVLPTDGSVSGSVSITWTPANMSFSTTGLGTNANFVNVPHTFTGDDNFSWVFSARTGGATQDLIIDDLVITTIPEPTGAALLGLASLGMLLRRRR